MNPSSIRNLSLFARRLLVKSPLSAQPLASLAAASASNRGKLRHFSTEIGDESSSNPGNSRDGVVPADDDDVTEEELKRRIQKFYDGDDEAIPSILEGILKRKLAGKNDEHLVDGLPVRGNEESISDVEEVDDSRSDDGDIEDSSSDDESID